MPRLRNRLGALGLLLTLGCPTPGPVDGGLGGGEGGAAGGGAGGGGVAGGGGTAGGAGGGTGGGAAGGAGGGGSGPVSCTTPARLEQLNARFSTYTTSGAGAGFIDPQTRRLFVWPASISSSLKSFITVRLVDAGTMQPDGGANAFVEALPVTGEIPTGTVTASTFDPLTGRSYALIYARDPFRYEVESFVFSDGGVHFTRHASTDAPDANGYSMRDLAVTGNQLGAIRGNALVPITLTATTASWGGEQPGSPFSDSMLYDAPNHRTIGVGGYQVTGPMMFEWIPEVKTRAALAPSWTKVTMSGMGPAAVPSPMVPPRPFIAFDTLNNRLLVTSTRPGMIGATPVTFTTLFEANLQTNAWSFLGDLNRSISSNRPFATDPHYPQVFEAGSYPPGLLSLAKGSELKALPFVTSGDLPPLSASTAAARLPDGRVLVSAGAQLFFFNEATRGWKAVRGATVPAEALGFHTLTLDATNNRVLLFGGQKFAIGTNNVWSIDVSTLAATQLTTTGTPPTARWNHSALVMNGQLIIAGGTTDGATVLGDVWALDVTTLAWKKLADVPGRLKPALIARDKEVWVIGGIKPGSLGEATLSAVDVTTGTVRSIAVQGAWPTRQGIFWAWAAAGDGLLVIDSGDSIDYSKNQLWELTVTGSVAQWRNSDPDALDDSLEYTLGVAGSGCDGALFLGPSSFRVRR